MLQFVYPDEIMKYNLTLADNDSEWDELVSESLQGNIFSDSRYLSSLCSPYTRFILRTPFGEGLAALVVMEDGQQMYSAPFPFTPYQGILFGKPVIGQPRHKRILSEYRITEFFINSLIERYGNFSMALSPAVNDLRPFLWYNYHNVDAKHFSIRNRYTAVLDLSNFRLEDYLNTIRTVRRQEYRKSKVELTEATDIGLFLDLYVKTFGRQDIPVTQKQLTLVKSIITSSLEDGYGRLSMAKTGSGVASMALFIFDHDCAYYLFGANDPEWRNSGASTALMVDNICNMSERGLSKLDFVGVNSPERGDFKLSFNPVLTAYHEVHLVDSMKA